MKKWALHRLVDLFVGYNRAASSLMYRVGYPRLVYTIGGSTYTANTERLLRAMSSTFISAVERALRDVIDHGEPSPDVWDEAGKCAGELFELSLHDAVGSIRRDARKGTKPDWSLS